MYLVKFEQDRTPFSFCNIQTYSFEYLWFTSKEDAIEGIKTIQSDLVKNIKLYYCEEILPNS